MTTPDSDWDQLVIAIKEQDLVEVHKILNQGVPHLPIMPIGGSLKMPIHHAVLTGNTQIVSLLLKFGANINEPEILAGDAYYHRVIPETPLDVGLRINNELMVSFLRTLGAEQGGCLFYYNKAGDLCKNKRL